MSSHPALLRKGLEARYIQIIVQIMAPLICIFLSLDAPPMGRNDDHLKLDFESVFLSDKNISPIKTDISPPFQGGVGGG